MHFPEEHETQYLESVYAVLLSRVFAFYTSLRLQDILFVGQTEAFPKYLI